LSKRCKRGFTRIASNFFSEEFENPFSKPNKYFAYFEELRKSNSAGALEGAATTASLMSAATSVSRTVALNSNINNINKNHSELRNQGVTFFNDEDDELERELFIVNSGDGQQQQHQSRGGRGGGGGAEKRRRFRNAKGGNQSSSNDFMLSQRGDDNDDDHMSMASSSFHHHHNHHHQMPSPPQIHTALV
jgi:hypothetical protein